MSFTTQKSSIYTIAIVGIGPKGLYAFERLLANLKGITSPIKIHLFNRSPYFGAGDIYDLEQPQYLIMNYHSDLIQMWSKELPKTTAKDELCFVDWLEEIHVENEFPKDYAPRAVVGEYLYLGFKNLKDNAPENVEIICHQAEVTDIQATENAYSIFLNHKKQFTIQAQQILLATGHPKPQATAERTRYQVFTSCYDRLSFTDFVYPVTQKLADIPADSTVLMKGLGLTFIDSVLCLTEGRGGQFLKQENDDFTYQPSENEPRYIFPFSRSGLPMIPRTANNNMPNPKLHYFTDTAVEQLKNQSAQIDFTQQLLPLIEQEIVVAYYICLFRQYNAKLNITNNFKEVEAQIDQFLKQHNINSRFTLQDLLDPYPESGDDQTFFLHYLDEVIEAARLGQERSPLAAAAAVWRSISSSFNELYGFGGFTPSSHQHFIEGYAGHFNRIAYGPPLRNLLKIRALAKAGILDFSFVRSPDLHLDETSACFTLQKETQAVHGDHLVDARIPKVSLTHEASALEKSLMKQGIIRLFENKNAQHDYCPGCMELNENGHPINENGKVIDSITVYGTPTEGITFDNDTLSRDRNDFASYWGKHIAKDIKRSSAEDLLITEHQLVTK